MAEDIKKENNKDLAEKVGTVINKSFVKSFADFFKKNAEEKTEDARAAKLASKEREKSLKIMSGLWKQSKLTAKASKAVSKATDTILSKWKLLVGLGLFLMPKEFWIKLKDGMFKMWNYLKGLDWGKIKTQVFDVLGSTIKLLAKVVGKIANLILGKKATRDEYDEQVKVLENMKKKKKFGGIYEESEKDFKERQKKQQELIDSYGGFDKDNNFIGKRQGGLVGENKSWIDVAAGLGTIALLLSPTGTLIAGLTAFKVGLAAVKWGKNKIIPKTDPKTTITDTKTTKTTQTKGQKGGPSDTAKKVKTPKPKTSIFGKTLKVVGKWLGPAAALYAGFSSANRKHEEKLAERAAGKTPRQMVNIDSQTPTSTKISRGMEDGLSYYGDMAKGAIAATIGAGGDVVKWIDPDAKLVILPTSKEVSDALDKAQKVGTKKYVEGVKNLGKNIGEVVDKISKTDIIPAGTKAFTSKQKKDDYVPKNSGRVRMETQPKEKGWWQKSKDWYDKKLAPFIGGNQHYGKKLVELQKMDTSAKPSTGRAKQMSNASDALFGFKTNEIKNNVLKSMQINPALAKTIHMSGNAFKASGKSMKITSGFRNTEAQRKAMEELRRDDPLQYAKNYTGYRHNKDMSLVNDSSTEKWLKTHISRHSTGNAIDVAYPKGIKGNTAKQESFVKSLNTTLGMDGDGSHAEAEGHHIHINTGQKKIRNNAKAFEDKFNSIPNTTGQTLQSLNAQNQGLNMGGGGNTTIVAPQTTKVSQSSTTAVMSSPTAGNPIDAHY